MSVTAIGNQALTSESYAKKVYMDYVYGTNSLGATSDDISAIEDKYPGSISRWKTQATSQDENEYEISDDDHAKNIDKGKAHASEETEFDGEADNGATTGAKIANYAGGIAGGLVGAAGSAGGIVALLGKGSKIMSKLKSSKWTSVYVAAALGALLLAYSFMLKSAHINKEPADACQQLQDDLLPEAQGKIAEAEGQMTQAMADTQEQADVATEANENADDALADKKARFDMYITSFLSLQEGAQAGTLTKDEAELYNSLIDALKSVGVDVEKIQNDTETVVQEAYANMDVLIGQFDEAIAELGEAQGVIDFARGFDEDTASNAQQVSNSTQVMQYGGVAGVVTMAVLGMAHAGMKWWEYAIGAVAIGEAGYAGYNFGQVIKEQKEFEQTALNEILVREQTADLNVTAMENYNTNIEDYAGYMEDVEGLEMTVPDETAVPEGATYVQGKDEDCSSNPFAQNKNNQYAPGGNGYQASMGYGSNYVPIIQGNKPLDNDGKVVVNDQGKVVLAPAYASAIQKTTGGKPLTEDQIPQVLANLLPKPFSLDNINVVMNGGEYKFEQAQDIVQTLTGKKVGTEEAGKVSKEATDLMKKVINFYTPIFQKAIAYGWSTNTSGAHKEA